MRKARGHLTNCEWIPCKIKAVISHLKLYFNFLNPRRFGGVLRLDASPSPPPPLRFLANSGGAQSLAFLNLFMHPFRTFHENWTDVENWLWTDENWRKCQSPRQLAAAGEADCACQRLAPPTIVCMFAPRTTKFARIRVNLAVNIRAATSRISVKLNHGNYRDRWTLEG